MKQFLLSNNPDKSGLINLDGEDYHYLVRVRRLATGESFAALLPNGESVSLKVEAIEGGVVTCKIGELGVSHQGGVSHHPRLILFQALPKADKMDLIVRQAAESGIAEIVPFVSEFSVARTSAGGQKFSRWERILKEARQQSGSKVATVLHEPLTSDELFSYWQEIRDKTNSVGLLFHHENVDKIGLEQKSLHGYLNISPKVVAYAIGPEGGFSDKEAEHFIENGFNPFMIGENILRTETAALFCAAAVRIILLERNAWELKIQS